MFGLFGRRRDKKRDEKLTWAQDASYTLLMLQMELGGAADYAAAQSRLASNYGFGYVFGFVDALIQRTGITDETAVVAELTIAHCRLFGTEEGSKIFGASLSRQTDSRFVDGRRTGAADAMRWLGSGCTEAPAGLTTYLSGREECE